MLTGRVEGFDRLRQRGGLSGYPSRAESEHDVSRTATPPPSLSYADGLAKAFAVPAATSARWSRHRRRRAHRRHGLGGAEQHRRVRPPGRHRGQRQRPLVRADDRRARRPPRDAAHCARLRAGPGAGQGVLDRTPVVGRPLYDTLHGIKKGLKDVVAPQGMFEDLGLKYIGPVDGHDVEAVEHALRRARAYGGAGDRARDHPQGLRLRRRPRPTRPTPCTRSASSTRRPAPRPPRPGDWTAAFADELVRDRGRAAGRRGHHGRDAAADRASTAFAERYPDAHLRRRHRRAARAHLARPGSPSAACTRWSPSTRRSSTGPSTRC